MMEGWVAVTHHGWFDFLSKQRTWDEVNFWTPSDHYAFRGTPGAPFLFKLKSPRNAIGGFGFFARFDRLPEWLAWECFQEGNGSNTLEAAHIVPYAKGGQHEVSNGLLLRSDIHRLFDKGYVTVTPEQRILVSPRLKADFENGKSYYPFDGKNLVVRPEDAVDLPSPNSLRWHNEHAFLS